MLKNCFFLISLWLSITAWAEQLDHVVAVVNEGVITASELNKQMATVQQQLQAQKMQVPAQSVLRKQVLQHLIDVNLELQLAKQYNISVDDNELNNAIGKIAANNHLTLEGLKNVLSKQGMSWKIYRENIRKEIILARLQQKTVGKEVIITPEQVEEYLKKPQHVQQNNQVVYHLQNIVIPVPEEPTPEQLQEAKKKAEAVLRKIKNGVDFNELALLESSGEFALEGGDLGERHLAELPEIFSREVVKMHVNQVVGPIRAGNGFQLIKLVAIKGADDKHEVMKTHVRHILLKPDTSTNTIDAKQQAKNLYLQLHSGKDFALLAKQYSLDVSSAVKGGDLGWVTPGELVPEFEKVMNDLAPHQISKPVKTVYGWHIVEVLERKIVDDSEAYKRQQVRLFLQQRKFTEAVQNWQQHIRAEAYVKILDKDLA